MKNGKSYISHRFRPLSNRAFICACVVAGLFFVGCRSSRNSVEETYQEVHAAIQESFTADTLNAAATSSETRTDTATIRADERAIISLKRDSAGRVVEIIAERSAKVDANTKRKTDRDHWFYGLNATRYSEASGSVDSVTKEKEEVTQEVDVSPPVGLVVLWCVCGVLFLICLRLELSELWRRKQEK